MGSEDHYVLKMACRNERGIVAAVAGFLLEAGLDILESAQYDDQIEERFFMRVLARGDANEGALTRAFAAIAGRFGMEWSLRRVDRLRRVMILVSKFDHCLVDLLYRMRIGELPMEVSAIVSNHPRSAFRSLDLDDLLFYHLPVRADTKSQQEDELAALIDDSRTDLIVLARYMQIFSDRMAHHLSGRCINIHHSFLPGFKGAKPYHQAHAHGVKLIGATAHYVTGTLDEGPIIEQDVERISHVDSPESLVRKGRDIERRVLSRAVRYHLDDRVIMNGIKTVVFPD